MGEYLYRLRPTRSDMLTTGPTDHESRIVAEHFEHLQRLCESGTVILAGRTLTDDPESMGIVIFRAESDTEAEAIVNSDPAVRQGVMTARLFPYRIALMNVEGRQPD